MWKKPNGAEVALYRVHISARECAKMLRVANWVWMTREITKMMVMVMARKKDATKHRYVSSLQWIRWVFANQMCDGFERKSGERKAFTRASSISIASLMAKKNLLNCKIDFSKKWKTPSARTNRQKRWLSLVKRDTKCRIYDYAVKAGKLLHLFCGMIKVAGKYFHLNDSGFCVHRNGAGNRRWAAT